MGLFSVDNPLDKVSQLYGQASNSYGAMTRKDGQTTTTTPPDKTVGGLIGSTAGMGLAGAMAAGSIGGTTITPGVGTLIGAGLGALSYFFS
jgi:hypothetical protein